MRGGKREIGRTCMAWMASPTKQIYGLAGKVVSEVKEREEHDRKKKMRNRQRTLPPPLIHSSAGVSSSTGQLSTVWKYFKALNKTGSHSPLSSISFTTSSMLRLARQSRVAEREGSR
jgi:hypothetical protein